MSTHLISTKNQKELKNIGYRKIYVPCVKNLAEKYDLVDIQTVAFEVVPNALAI